MKKIAWLESSSQADFVYSIFNRRLFDLSTIGIVNVVANDNLQLTVAEHLLALHFLIAYEGADGCRVLFSLEGDNDFAIGATCSIADYRFVDVEPVDKVAFRRQYGICYYDIPTGNTTYRNILSMHAIGIFEFRGQHQYSSYRYACGHLRNHSLSEIRQRHNDDNRGNVYYHAHLDALHPSDGFILSISR